MPAAMAAAMAARCSVMKAGRSTSVEAATPFSVTMKEEKVAAGSLAYLGIDRGEGVSIQTAGEKGWDGGCRHERQKLWRCSESARHQLKGVLHWQRHQHSSGVLQRSGAPPSTQRVSTPPPASSPRA